MQTSRSWRRLAPVLLALGVVVIIVLIILHKSANTTIYLAPSVANLQLDGKTIKPGGHYIVPGKHTLRATMTGFSDGTKSFVVPTKGATKVFLALSPNSVVGEQWYANHPDDNNLYQSIVQNEATSTSREQVTRLPLIKELPHVDNFYRVDYGKSLKNPNDPVATALYITVYSAAGKQQAIQWLTFKGYDPTLYEIVYIDKYSDGL
ncbi:MAG: hypothetical protein WC498_03830 [Candidatus Saccharimonadales bacterium]